MRYIDNELLVEFLHDDRFSRTFEEECGALHLRPGETISQSSTDVLPGDQVFVIYVVEEIAERILGLPKGTIINAKVRTIAGMSIDSNMLTERRRLYFGLLVIDLRDIQPSS